MFLEGIGSRLNLFSGVWKPLCKYGLLGIIWFFNADHMCILNDSQVQIGWLSDLLGGHR